MSKIENIIIHCSDSDFGTAITVDGWHRARGWSKIGYLGVILNGYVKPGIYWDFCDGSWEWGRALDKDAIIEPDEVEAQAFGWNEKSVGICFIGKNIFSAHQFMTARERILQFMKLWGLQIKSVLGHYEIDKAGKTCPNIKMDIFRAYLTDSSLITKLMMGD